MDGDDMVGEAEAVTARKLVIILASITVQLRDSAPASSAWPASSDVVKTPM